MKKVKGELWEKLHLNFDVTNVNWFIPFMHFWNMFPNLENAIRRKI